MLLWQGACVVHDEFKTWELEDLKRRHPGAKILVHPESPEGVIKLADAVGSTTQLIKATQEMEAPLFIVATDKGILHKMQQLSPHKQFVEAPTSGAGATCKSCAHCPWMAMNGLANLAHTLETGANEIHVDPALGRQAYKCIDRMLAFSAQLNAPKPSGDLAQDQRTIFKEGMGPA